MTSKKIQLVRLYRGGDFVGLDVAVDGALLGATLSTTLVSTPDQPPKLIVEFALGVDGADELESAITLNLDTPHS